MALQVGELIAAAQGLVKELANAKVMLTPDVATAFDRLQAALEGVEQTARKSVRAEATTPLGSHLLRCFLEGAGCKPEEIEAVTRKLKRIASLPVRTREGT